MSKSDIEISSNIIGIIRVGNDSFKYGDKYHWVACLVKIDKETVEISGTLNSPSKDDWVSILKSIKELGYKYVLITRIKNNNKIKKIFDVTTGVKIKKPLS